MMYLVFENNKVNINHRRLWLLFVFIFVSLTGLIKDTTTSPLDKNQINSALETKLALSKHPFRFKRQSQSNVGGGIGDGSTQSPRLTPSNPNQPDASNNLQDVPNQEEKQPEEVLTSLRCDFGTSDAPDLCKFKVLDSSNSLSRGASTWTHGSGKLALYQGGPLQDASDRNDTTGGYIFYETSNPFATLGQQQHHHLNQSFLSSSHNGNAAYDQPTSDLYSTIASGSSGYNNKARSINNKDQQSNDNSFQRLTSTRIAIGPSSSSVNGPAFVSANLTAPGPSGMCLSFKYAIQGLSAEELRIHVNDHKTERSRQIWANSESAGSNWTRGEVLYSVTNMHSIMFSASSGGGMSHLKDAQQRKFRGYLALDEIEANKHDSSGETSACRGHCNFDGDLCGWTNGENGPEDDFDWSFGRGSDNLFTGPARDYISSTNNDLTGSYLYTDSGYPRRPGDRAILVSPMFPTTPTNDAMCMRLAVHMFGSGIGSLAIKIRYADSEAATGGPVQQQPPSGTGGQANLAAANNAQPQGANNFNNLPVSSFRSGGSGGEGKSMNNDVTIWEMSGDAGNSWHQAQTSVSSSRSPFQVVVEGLIGENHLGNIAIDEISFSSGPCPTSPPVASKNVGDCTFEQSMCYWRNPDADMHLDDLDWIKTSDDQSIHGPNFDHTSKKRSGSFLKLENTFKEPKSGSRAFLLSPIFQPKASGNVQCLSFYYYMFMRSISSSGPNLGTIRVYLASNSELVPIWRLTNPISSPSWKHARASLSTALVDGVAQAPTKMFQIAFEGIWGDAPGGAIAIDDITVFDGACDIMPAEAKSVPGECTFDVDLCSWLNKTTDLSEGAMSNSMESGSPFLQSVNQVGGLPSTASSRLQQQGGKPVSWQLATIDSRPVNLQDHTYKAPIGYIYLDILENNYAGNAAQRFSYILQSAESTLQQGQQVTQCLSFWFAAFGRQDGNQLSVHLTQASAPPPSSDASSETVRPQTFAPNNNQTGGTEEAGENSGAWRSVDGRMLWSVSLRNLTEPSRRKWQYAQTSLKADSNYIVRFVAQSSDGGFALDDISYYEGACDTRPAYAKIRSEEGESSGGVDEGSSAPFSPPSSVTNPQTGSPGTNIAATQPKQTSGA